MTWRGVIRLLKLLTVFSGASGATKPAPKPPVKKHSKRPPGTLTKRCAWVIWLVPMLLLTACATSATKPPPPEPSRKCFQWLISGEQNVYVYENGALIARINTEPYDAVVSGWCLLKFAQDLANESRRLSQ